jgi:hypothetical protein
VCVCVCVCVCVLGGVIYSLAGCLLELDGESREKVPLILGVLFWGYYSLHFTFLDLFY